MSPCLPRAASKPNQQACSSAWQQRWQRQLLRPDVRAHVPACLAHVHKNKRIEMPQNLTSRSWPYKSPSLACAPSHRTAGRRRHRNKQQVLSTAAGSMVPNCRVEQKRANEWQGGAADLGTRSLPKSASQVRGSCCGWLAGWLYTRLSRDAMTGPRVAHTAGEKNELCKTKQSAPAHRVVLDVAHQAGAVPLQLRHAGIDLGLLLWWDMKSRGTDWPHRAAGAKQPKIAAACVRCE